VSFEGVGCALLDSGHITRKVERKTPSRSKPIADALAATSDSIRIREVFEIRES
jgi:hypothetical protein